jgi:hypothetical protein
MSLQNYHKEYLQLKTPISPISLFQSESEEQSEEYYLAQIHINPYLLEHVKIKQKMFV